MRRAGAVPMVSLAWLRPGAKHPDFHALDLLASILADGISSRMHQALVETRLATDVGAWNWALVDPYLFILSATASEKGDPERIEAAIRKTVEAVRAEGVTDAEIERGRAQIETQIAFAREGTYGAASTLAEAVGSSDWDWWVDYPRTIAEVSRETVQRVAARYLGPDQVTVGWFLPEKSSEAA